MRAHGAVTLGTGVGGGIVIGDLLVEGEKRRLGTGHIIIDYLRRRALCSAASAGISKPNASATAVVSAGKILQEGRPARARFCIDAGEDLRH